MKGIDIQSPDQARSVVIDYCAHHKMTRKEFADLIDCSFCTFERFLYVKIRGRVCPGYKSVAYAKIRMYFRSHGVKK